jgi:hypothetical protein
LQPLASLPAPQARTLQRAVKLAALCWPLKRALLNQKSLSFTVYIVCRVVLQLPVMQLFINTKGDTVLIQLQFNPMYWKSFNFRNLHFIVANRRLYVLCKRKLKFKKMANVKKKKDINYVLGDIIEAVYLFEISTTGKPTTETNDLIDEAMLLLMF